MMGGRVVAALLLGLVCVVQRAEASVYSAASATITHTGSTKLTLASTSGTIVVESVTFNGGAVTDVSALTASGTITGGTITDGTTSTNSGAVTGVKSIAINPAHATTSAIVVTNGVAQTSGDLVSITGTAGQSALKVATGNFAVAGTSTLTGALTAAAITGSGLLTLSAQAAVVISHNTATITHTGSTTLTIASGSGNVVVESVTFNGGALSGVTTISVGGNQVVGARQAAISDVATSNDPGDGTIAGLTISGTYSQAEIQALRTNCEKLRDWGNDLRTAVNLLITRMEAHGLITSN